MSAASTGEPVLFVSHNMAAVENLCSRAILLEKGRLRNFNCTQSVVASYLSCLREVLPSQVIFEEKATAGFAGAHIEPKDGVNNYGIRMGDPLAIVVHLNRATKLSSSYLVGFSIENEKGIRIGAFHTGMRPSSTLEGNPRKYLFALSSLNLSPGSYNLTLHLTNGTAEYLDKRERCLGFVVNEKDVFASGFNYSADYGVAYFDTRWSLLRD